MFYIGEALIGTGNEVAHIDLIIGDRDGPAGAAFLQGLTNLSVGHTPLLAVIRPNLLTKPATLIVPKVTLKDLSDSSKIFGPAQTAVARAVADCVQEGIIPKEKADEWVVIASVFIHPKAENYRKIYQFNYGATKLAIDRALSNYPSVKKILAEKDRSKHPIMGFRVLRLWNPPYLQVALDVDSMTAVEKIVPQLPNRERILIEAGTPLIKKFGVGAVGKIRELKKDAFIIADLKTLDVGRVEVKMAADETADAVAISGLATADSINNSIQEAKKEGIYSLLDMMNVDDPVSKLQSLKYEPDIVLLHRSVDSERAAAEHGVKGAKESGWETIKEIKAVISKNRLIAVAGGITPKNTQEALKSGADIIIVGRYITQSKDIEHAAREFLDAMPEDADTMRVALDEDE